MTSPAARKTVLLFLLLVGAAAAYLEYDLHQRQARLFADEHAQRARLDTMLAAVDALAIAQRGYFEPTRGGNVNVSGPAFQRVRQLNEELKRELDGLRSGTTEPEAVEQISLLAAAIENFSSIDTRVRTNVANDTYYSAADLVFSAATTELQSATKALTIIKDVTVRAAADSRAGLDRRALLVAGGVAIVWIVGLLCLVPLGAVTTTVPMSEAASTPMPASSPAGDALLAAPADMLPADETTAVHTSSPLPSPPPALLAPLVDVAAAANVCSALARATSAAELREILSSAAATIGATGLVIWLGAGEELFPVLGHGYDTRMLARLGPLSRQGDNATSRAWRDATIAIVAGDQARAGAVVAPLVSTQGCIGVLSAEVPAGTETDTMLRAIASMFAAQLSTVVAAWPEPSAASDSDATTHTGPIAVTL